MLCQCLISIACVIVAYLFLIRYKPPVRISPPPIEHSTLLCTVSSMDDGIPTHPITFAAHFYKKRFVLAVSPLASSEEIPPDPKTGTYAYKPNNKSSGSSTTLYLKQEDEGVSSVLVLTFTHLAGGTLTSKVYQNEEVISKQSGSFCICPR